MELHVIYQLIIHVESIDQQRWLFDCICISYNCQPLRLNKEMDNLLEDMTKSHESLSTQLTDMRMDHKDGTLKSEKLDKFLGTLL